MFFFIVLDRSGLKSRPDTCSHEGKKEAIMALERLKIYKYIPLYLACVFHPKT